MNSFRNLLHVVARPLIAVAFFGALWSPCAVHAATTYTVTDLGVLPGGFSSFGMGINSAGQVAGTSDASDQDGNGKRGFMTGDSGMINLGLPPVNSVLFSEATGLNDAGQVIVNGNNGANHAFIWQNGGYSDLTNLADAVYSEGHRINNDGHVVGSVVLELPGNNFPHHAFYYDGKQMIDLNAMFGGNYSDAADINNSGTMVGEARFSGSSIIHGYKIENGVVTNLGPSPSITSEANGVNSINQIAGGGYFDGVHEHPMKYVDGQMTDLGLLPQATAGTANAINDAGVIVGFCVMPGNLKRAFVYSNGQMLNLTDLADPGSGWIIEEANDINFSGAIAATARDPQGHKHAVVLTPPSCAPDISGDNVVNAADLLMVINNWGALGGPADVNQDGIVNSGDLLFVIASWGPCS